MKGTVLFDDFARLLRLAIESARTGISTAEAMERKQAAQSSETEHGRREFLIRGGELAATGAFASLGAPMNSALAGLSSRTSLRVGIVGAGMAGLVCAHQLQESGIPVTLYEATARTGGQMLSVRGIFPGQVAEAGAEFIDPRQRIMRHYIQRFNLELEDVSQLPGEVFYYFGGRRRTEAAIVDELRDFMPAIKRDLARLSPLPTARNHSDLDRRLDNTSLLEYLSGQNGARLAAGAIARAAIVEAYTAQFGVEANELSSLNFLLSIRPNRGNHFEPLGPSPGPRYHLVNGSDQVSRGIAALLKTPIEFGMALTRVRKTAAGSIELIFRKGSENITRTHDAVVLAIPFTVLRNIVLDATLGLPPEKISTINNLGVGTVSKMMVAFDSRPWVAQGCNGVIYSDLPNHGLCWETNAANASGGRAVLTNNAGGERGANIDPTQLQSEVRRFLTDLEAVIPGVLRAASRGPRGDIIAQLENWNGEPFTKGHCSSYRRGQFTSLGGIEGTPVGNLYFAGEQTMLFNEWRETMEGAALSGIRVAEAIHHDFKLR